MRCSSTWAASSSSIDWDRAFARWAADSGERVETLRSRYRFDEPYERHERGEIGESEYYAALRDSLAIDLTDAQWAAGMGRDLREDEIAPTVGAIARAKDRIPRLRVLEFERRAPRGVVAASHSPTPSPTSAGSSSRRIWDCANPERADIAFEAIARAIGVSPAGILFFDDTLENVEGARAAGLQTVHVREPAGRRARAAALVRGQL